MSRSASTWTRIHQSSRRIPSGSSASTLESSSTPTIPTGTPSRVPTSARNVTDSNAHNATSRGKNTALRIGRNNGRLLPNATLTSSGSVGTSFTSCRTTTLGSTTSWRLKTWTRRAWSNCRATRATGQERRGGRSCGCFNTSASAKGRTSWQSTREGRPRSARPAASRRTSRCGSVNTRVPRVGSRRIGTRMRRGIFFLAVSKT